MNGGFAVVFGARYAEGNGVPAVRGSPERGLAVRSGKPVVIAADSTAMRRLTGIKAGSRKVEHSLPMSERPLMEAAACRVLDLAAETQFSPNGIVSRMLLVTPTARLILFGFDAGQELTEHTSPHYAVVQILSGSCEWKLGEETRTLRAGEVLYMPPQLPHAVRALERFSMLLTLVRTTGMAAT